MLSLVGRGVVRARAREVRLYVAGDGHLGRAHRADIDALAVLRRQRRYVRQAKRKAVGLGYAAASVFAGLLISSAAAILSASVRRAQEIR